MKKTLVILLLCMLSMPAIAQDAFKRTKFLNLGYVSSTLTPKDGAAWKGNYGFSFTTGNRYWLNKQPIAGILKFGLDALWFDINYVNLKTVTDEYDDDDWKTRYGYDDDYDYDDDDSPFSEFNTGSHQLELGLGVGPSVTVAPFATKSSQLKDLRASLYFHVVPSVSLILMNEGDDLKVNYGFVPFVKFGGCLNWKALSFWAEGRWGSANYKMASAEDEENEDGDMIKFDKWSMSTSSVRVGIGLSF